jgi:hypothetical protein
MGLSYVMRLDSNIFKIRSWDIIRKSKAIAVQYYPHFVRNEDVIQIERNRKETRVVT